MLLALIPDHGVSFLLHTNTQLFSFHEGVENYALTITQTYGPGGAPVGDLKIHHSLIRPDLAITYEGFDYILENAQHFLGDLSIEFYSRLSALTGVYEENGYESSSEKEHDLIAKKVLQAEEEKLRLENKAKARELLLAVLNFANVYEKCRHWALSSGRRAQIFNDHYVPVQSIFCRSYSELDFKKYISMEAGGLERAIMPLLHVSLEEFLLEKMRETDLRRREDFGVIRPWRVLEDAGRSMVYSSIFGGFTRPLRSEQDFILNLILQRYVDERHAFKGTSLDSYKPGVDLYARDLKKLYQAHHLDDDNTPEYAELLHKNKQIGEYLPKEEMIRNPRENTEEIVDTIMKMKKEREEYHIPRADRYDTESDDR